MKTGRTKERHKITLEINEIKQKFTIFYRIPSLALSEVGRREEVWVWGRPRARGDGVCLGEVGGVSDPVGRAVGHGRAQPRPIRIGGNAPFGDRCAEVFHRFARRGISVCPETSNT